MEELIIQPVGGFAGGAAHLKSEGRMPISALSPEDRKKIEELFHRAQPEPGNFYYRITRAGSGRSETVNAPPDAVPAALIATIKTVLE